MADGWRNHWFSLGSSHHPTEQRRVERNKEQNKRQLNSKRTELWHSQTRTELLCYASLLRNCSLSRSISLCHAHSIREAFAFLARGMEDANRYAGAMRLCNCLLAAVCCCFWSNISKRNLLNWSNGLLVAPFSFFVRTTSNSNNVATGLQRGQLRSVVAFCAQLFLIFRCSLMVKSEIKAKQLNLIITKTRTRRRSNQRLFLAAINAELKCNVFYTIFFPHNVKRQFCASLNHWNMNTLRSSLWPCTAHALFTQCAVHHHASHEFALTCVRNMASDIVKEGHDYNTNLWPGHLQQCIKIAHE